MEFLYGFAVLALLGGAAIAALLWRQARWSKSDAGPVVVKSEPLTLNAINMATIRVHGVGGLGMVAVAIGVGIYLPGVRQAIGEGLALGVLMAAFLIYRRRRTGPMPSSGAHPGASVMLAIEDSASADPANTARPTDAARLSPGFV